MKQRVMSGVVLVAFLIAIVVFNQSCPIALNIAISIIAALAVYELLTAMSMQKKYFLMIPSILTAVLMPYFETSVIEQGILYAYTAILFLGLIIHHREVTFRDIGVIYSMTMMIPLALEKLVSLRSLGGKHGMFYVIIAISAAWVADVGAYFAGSLLGKHKLCPEISPKKTIEGVVGGFALNIFATLFFGWLFSQWFYGATVKVSYFSLFIIAVVGTVMSIIGDLSFSLIKRSCHIKDFGQVIPGHGGILDRFDSVIFVSPFIYFWVQMFPIVL